MVKGLNHSGSDAARRSFLRFLLNGVRWSRGWFRIRIPLGTPALRALVPVLLLNEISRAHDLSLSNYRPARRHPLSGVRGSPNEYFQ